MKKRTDNGHQANDGVAGVARRRHRHTSRRKERSKKSLIRLNDRLSVLDQILRFRGFLESGFEPKISDVEIVVMFTDVRGFTHY
jgi:hypothetical protein